MLTGEQVMGVRIKLVMAAVCLFCSVSALAGKKEPAWLMKLDYSQRQKFFTCKPLSSLKRHGGPFDYNATDSRTLHMKKLVEEAHFTLGVQQGRYGNAGTLEGDLDYVLQHFPNNPKALYVMGRLQESDRFNPRSNADRKDYFYPSMRCYMSRALAMNKKDPNIQLVVAILEHKQQAYKKAEKHYLLAIKYAPNNFEAHYNLGLLYLDTKRPKKALEQAKIAYRGGYPLEGLKMRLKDAGVWPNKQK